MSYYRRRPSTHSERSQSSTARPPSRTSSSRPQPSGSQDLKTLFQTLDNLLVLKASDGLAHTRYGKPNLNADINRTLTTIKSHPRFNELQYGGPAINEENFLDIWAELEDLAKGWKDDDTRIQRLQQSEGVYAVQTRLRETVLEGGNVHASGELEESWW